MWRRPNATVACRHQSVAALKEAELFRMYVPETLGGLEVPPQVLYRVVEGNRPHRRVHRLVHLYPGRSACLFGGFLPDAVAEHMFGADPGGHSTAAPSSRQASRKCATAVIG